MSKKDKGVSMGVVMGLMTSIPMTATAEAISARTAAVEAMEAAADSATAAAASASAGWDAQDMISSSEASTTAAAAHPKGSYFILGGTLYQATADIAQGGTIVTSGTGQNCRTVPGGLGRDVSDVKNTISEIENLTEEAEITWTDDGLGYVKATDGSIITYNVTNINYTDYIDVSRYSSITYKQIKTTGSSDLLGLVFYKADKTFDSGVKCLRNQSEPGYVDKTVDVPATAKYARASMWASTLNYGDFAITGKVNTQLIQKISGLEDDLEDLAETVGELNAQMQVKEELTGWSKPSAMNYARPQDKDAAGWTSVTIGTGSSTEQYLKVPCKPGDTFLIGAGSSGNYIRAYIFENASGNTKPSDTAWCAASNPNTVSNLIVTAPDGAVYLYIDRKYEQDIAGSYYVVSMKKYVDESIGEHLPNAGLRVVSFGDSIFGNYRANYGPNESISHMVSVLTGMECINCAFGGTHGHASTGRGPVDFPGLAHAIVSGDWTDQEAYASDKGDDYIARIHALEAIDFSTIDIVTISYGTNDWSYGITVSTFKTGLLDGIDTLAGAYPNLRFLLCTPIIRFMASDGDPSEEAEDEDDVDTSSETIVDSDNALMENTHGLKISDFAEGVEEVGKARHMPVCENYWSLGVNLANRETFFGNSMVHPNVYGRRLIAHHVADELNKM